MNYRWDSHLSDGEEVKVDFGVSNVYSGGVLVVLTAIGIIIAFTNLVVGLLVFVLGFVYWYYLSRGRRFAFTTKGIIVVDSFLNKTVVHINYSKITDVTIDQSWIDIAGGWGTIIINTAGSSTPEAFLTYVDKPQQLKNKLDELAESAKDRK